MFRTGPCSAAPSRLRSRERVASRASARRHDREIQSVTLAREPAKIETSTVIQIGGPMRSNRVHLLVALAFTLVVAVAARAQQQRQPPDPARALTGQLTSITKQVMEMAEDFPAEKYEFKATPEVRSFRQV